MTAANQHESREYEAGKRMHHMDLFQTLLFEIYFQSRRLFLGMHVIGSLTRRDVFVVVQSVLASESTESVNFVDELESSQREVVTIVPEE